MKKSIIILVLVSFALACNVGFAKEKTSKGASESAYEHASPQAVFNRISDWFSTVGKSEEEKEKILAERKAKRAAKRAEEEAKKAQKELEKKKKELLGKSE
ncbi:MAG: hypothetical protein JW734_09250 [Candidatus Omnitrophica bacterium]|nr:hypothetical protein [Candidatus Omnitrophota bacterium]